MNLKLGPTDEDELHNDSAKSTQKEVLLKGILLKIGKNR